MYYILCKLMQNHTPVEQNNKVLHCDDLSGLCWASLTYGWVAAARYGTVFFFWFIFFFFFRLMLAVSGAKIDFFLFYVVLTLANCCTSNKFNFKLN